MLPLYSSSMPAARCQDLMTSSGVTAVPSENLAPSRNCTLYSVSETFSMSSEAARAAKASILA